MINYDRLPEYRKGVRPVGSESLPAYIDRELTRAQTVIGELTRIIADLNARLATLEP